MFYLFPPRNKLKWINSEMENMLIIKEMYSSHCDSDHVWWPILEIYALHLPIQSAHTHSSEHTHTEQWAAIYAAVPGEQLGFRCLAQVPLSCGIEGGESAGHSLPPPTIPAGPRLELATFRLGVRLSNHYAKTSHVWIAFLLYFKWFKLF